MKARVFFQVCLGLAVAASCRQPPVDRVAPPATVTVTMPSSKAEPAAPAPKAAVAADPIVESAKADDDLQSEEREANPLSETVTMLRDTDHAGWSTLCCDLRARALNDEKPCSWPTSL
jgi:hypothetical protein